MSRPLIVVPARFSASASALRYRAVVTARAVGEGVLRAGGEPLTVHPWTPSGPDEVGERLGFADGVLLPGGGDLDPSLYDHAAAHETVYDVDVEQDAFDLAVARWALAAGVPTLAICRGTQVVNVSRGGSLEQHMADPHLHRVDRVHVEDPGLADVLGGPSVEVSCYHHQCLDRIGDGLAVAARAVDGTPEAVTAPGLPGWFLGVQWHPEDTAGTDAVQQGLFDVLVRQAAAHREVRERGARPA